MSEKLKIKKHYIYDTKLSYMRQVQSVYLLGKEVEHTSANWRK